MAWELRTNYTYSFTHHIFLLHTAIHRMVLIVFSPERIEGEWRVAVLVGR